MADSHVNDRCISSSPSIDKARPSGSLKHMPKKRRTITMYDLIAHLATKRDLQELSRKTEAGFDQLVVTLNTVVKLMQREIRAAQTARPRQLPRRNR